MDDASNRDTALAIVAALNVTDASGEDIDRVIALIDERYSELAIEVCDEHERAIEFRRAMFARELQDAQRHEVRIADAQAENDRMQAFVTECVNRVLLAEWDRNALRKALRAREDHSEIEQLKHDLRNALGQRDQAMDIIRRLKASQ